MTSYVQSDPLLLLDSPLITGAYSLGLTGCPNMPLTAIAIRKAEHSPNWSTGVRRLERELGRAVFPCIGAVDGAP